MARGLGEVLDVYLGGPPPTERGRTLLIPLDRSARIAAGVAVRIVESLYASGFGIGLEAADPPARALCGAPPVHAGRLRVQIATGPGTVRPDGILVILAGGPSAVWASARAWTCLASPAPMAMLQIGARDDERPHWLAAETGGVWLATIPESDAMRAALGLRCQAVERAAATVAGWLSRTLSPF